MLKRYRWLYPILFCALALGIIYQSGSLFHTLHLKNTLNTQQFPYESFAYVSVDLRMPSSIEGAPQSISSKGSGTVVGRTQSGNAAILTANHVCNPAAFVIAVFSMGAEKNLSITDFYGNVYPATIILTDIQNDLCLLEVEGFDNPGVPLAEDPSRLGEKVYSVAAPMAFFSPGMVPMLDGYYSGDVYSSNGTDSVYTVPASQGSSGSSVINEDGEIVGVVHSSLSGFSGVAISSTYTQVKAFLLKFEYLLGGTLR